MKVSQFFFTGSLVAYAACAPIDDPLSATLVDQADGGSDAQEVEVEERTSALVGHQDTAASCSPYTEALLAASSRMARTVMNSRAFYQCVQGRMERDYIPCGDPFSDATGSRQIALAWRAAFAANHMEYSCSYSTDPHRSASAHYQGWGSRGTHTVDLADDWAKWFGDWRWYSGLQPLDWRASGLVHEFMHTHDYAHPNEGCPEDYHGGFNSVPYIYGSCVYEVLDESFARCPDFDTGIPGSLQLIASYGGTLCRAVSDSQHRVALRAHNGRYLRALDGGGQDVDAGGLGHGRWETMFLIDINRGRLMSGDWVNVKTFNGAFLRRNGHELDARMEEPAASTAARFQVIVAGGGLVSSGRTVSLRADNGSFVVAENGGGSAANANRRAIGMWERFTLEQPRRSHVVRLRAQSTNRFMHVKRDGKLWIDATRSSAESQAFWMLDHNGGDLEDGDPVSLETLRTSRFVSTCASGTGHVTGTADYLSACSRYTVIKLGGSSGPRIQHGDPIALKASNERYLTGVPEYPGLSNQLHNYFTWAGPWQRFTLQLAQEDRWPSR